MHFLHCRRVATRSVGAEEVGGGDGAATCGGQAEVRTEDRSHDDDGSHSGETSGTAQLLLDKKPHTHRLNLYVRGVVVRYDCVCVISDQRERERKNSVASFVELSKVDEIAAARRKEGKQSVREKQKRWKEREREIAETRPTLISRQDQVNIWRLIR